MSNEPDIKSRGRNMKTNNRGGGSQMNRNRKRRNRNRFNIEESLERVFSMPWRQVISIVLMILSVIGVVSIISYSSNGDIDQSVIVSDQSGEVKNVFGLSGARLSHFLVSEFSGYPSLLYFIYLFLFSYFMFNKSKYFSVFNILKYLFLVIFYATWGALTFSYIESFVFNFTVGYGWGGKLGSYLLSLLTSQLGPWGCPLVIVASLVIILMFTSSRFASMVDSVSLSKKYDNVADSPSKSSRKSLFSLPKLFSKSSKTEPQKEDKKIDFEPDENKDDEVEYNPIQSLETTNISSPSVASGIIIEKAPEVEMATKEQLEENNPSSLEMRHYRMPSVDILKNYPDVVTDPSEIERNQRIIVDTLSTFRINVTANKATIGPTVTLYEVIPDRGVKVESILSSQTNLAMALKCEGVRIVAMPENGFVGIEVPNSNPQIVSMRSILSSQRFFKAKEKMQLPIGIGKSITNEPYIFDLAKTPHLLVAGATGQGKSVGLNAIITSLLYSKKPDDLKFVLIDPKMLEFAVYEEISNHFLATIPNTDNPIVTDMSLVIPTLNSLCIEMDERYKLLAKAKVKNLKEYNQAITDGVLSRKEYSKMPYIVLVIDEFADLIMTSGKEVETPIARIAQKARAAGIHMIIATQRPSTKVITGLIKSNFPARMSFKVVQSNDSRIILDNNGAENLIGRGDMLFSQGSDMVRLQCAFMDNGETDALMKYISQQESDGHPFELPEVELDNGQSNKIFDSSQKDPLFEDAARMIVESGVGSTSNIQRKFNIGFNRAGRIMDQIEGAGIVGPQIGSKPREVKVSDISLLEDLLSRL